MLSENLRVFQESVFAHKFVELGFSYKIIPFSGILRWTGLACCARNGKYRIGQLEQLAYERGFAGTGWAGNHEDQWLCGWCVHSTVVVWYREDDSRLFDVLHLFAQLFYLGFYLESEGGDLQPFGFDARSF